MKYQEHVEGDDLDQLLLRVTLPGRDATEPAAAAKGIGGVSAPRDRRVSDSAVGEIQERVHHRCNPKARIRVPEVSGFRCE